MVGFSVMGFRYGTGDDNCHYQNCEALVNELVAQDKYHLPDPQPISDSECRVSDESSIGVYHTRQDKVLVRMHNTRLHRSSGILICFRIQTVRMLSKTRKARIHASTYLVRIEY